MENKIFEFLEECQNHIGQFQDITQIEEVVTQLINIVYFLVEKIDQMGEEDNQRLENVQSELAQLQELYYSANKEIEELAVQYKKQIIICEQLEDKLQLREIELQQEKDQEYSIIRRDNREMVKSMQLQQQYIDTVIQKNENQQTEIKELVLKIENLQTNKRQQQSSKAISPPALFQQVSIHSENQTPIVKFQSSQNSQVSLQPLNDEGTSRLTRTLHYVRTHSKNQSLNWCQLSTITQTLRSVCQSQVPSQGNIQKVNLEEELKNEAATQNTETKQQNLNSFAQNQIIKQENPYFDFFILISQSVKLDLNKTAYYLISVDDLFEKFIKDGIPFNKWYSEIKQYILNYQSE